MGLAGTAAKTGIAVSAFELHAVFTLAMLGWFFLPVYRATGVFTLPEYMFKRFGGTRIRIYLAVMSLALYVFTKVAICRHESRRPHCWVYDLAVVEVYVSSMVGLSLRYGRHVMYCVFTHTVLGSYVYCGRQCVYCAKSKSSLW